MVRSTHTNRVSAWASSCPRSGVAGLVGTEIPEQHEVPGSAIPFRRLGFAAISSMARARSRRPASARLRASTGTTGTPRTPASVAASRSGSTEAVGESVAVAARSSMVRATTSGTPVSATCARRYSDRASAVESRTTMAAPVIPNCPERPSAAPELSARSRTASALTCSSAERARRLQVPGRSTIERSTAEAGEAADPADPREAVRQVPVASSTVVPGALVVRCRAPVRALNRVDLPTFGPPTSRTRIGAGRVEVADRPEAGAEAGPWQLIRGAPRLRRLSGQPFRHRVRTGNRRRR